MSPKHFPGGSVGLEILRRQLAAEMWGGYGALYDALK